jgi:hypothetical protein
VIAGVSLATLVIIAVALLVGAAVQSVVGLGLGLVAAPVTTLVAPELMPGVLIALAMVLPCLSLVVEHDEIDWRGLAWALPPRVLGTVLGVVVVSRFSERSLGIAVGLMVLLAVALTWRAVSVPINRATLMTAGVVSGVTGTATSIGGPPFALLYQHRSARQIRTTLAVYFLLGAAFSLVGLAASGDLSRHQVLVAALLVPMVLLGLLVGVRLRTRLRQAAVRPAVLIVCAASALTLLVRSLV